VKTPDINNTAQQARSAVNGIANFTVAIANLDPGRAQWYREPLDTPEVDIFGTHTDRLKLRSGQANIKEEIALGSTIKLKVVSQMGVKYIGIGRTPGSLDPARGGHFLAGAGRDRQRQADDYFMVVSDGTTVTTQYYLSEQQLEGIVVSPGARNVSLNPFEEAPEQFRRIDIEGRVESVTAYQNPTGQSS
jgi:hypothetical protein